MHLYRTFTFNDKNLQNKMTAISLCNKAYIRHFQRLENTDK